MEFVKLVWIYFLVEIVTGTVKTIPSLEVILHHSPTFTCTYTYSKSKPDWIFTRWYKLIPNGNGTNDIPLAILQNRVDPSWLEATEDFKNRSSLLESSTANTVSFDIQINDFLCDDQGMYECRVYTFNAVLKSTTELVASAHPGPPRIHDDLIQVKENDSFSIQCEANIGLPPIRLRWWYKHKDSSIYQLVVDGVQQRNKPAEDCTFEGLSRVTVMMAEDLDGAVYMCATSGELGVRGSPSNFDEVELQLHRTTTTPRPTTTTMCEGESCEKSEAVIDDGKNSAHAHHPSFLQFSLVFLVTVTVLRTLFSS